MFKMRGMGKEELLAQLPQTASCDATPNQPEPTIEPPKPEPLQTDGFLFWQGSETPSDLFEKVEIPAIHAQIPKRLGNFPYWRGKERFIESMQSIYAQASEQGLNTFLGEGSNFDNSDPSNRE